MIFTHTLNTKDKVRSLSILLEEIEHANILSLENKNSKIENLKSICYEIDWHINQSIEFAKTNYLREERIVLLIEHGKRLKKIQKTYEKELIKLSSKRDLENEYELNTAFDFDLNPKREIIPLENAVEIENRIRRAVSQIKKPFTEEAWFKVGLCFAEGKMEKYLLNGVMNPNWSARKIAEELNLPECQKYFLGTLNNYDSTKSNSSKNIFNNLNNIEKIIEYCNDNKISISESFRNRYNELKEKSIYFKK